MKLINSFLFFTEDAEPTTTGGDGVVSVLLIAKVCVADVDLTNSYYVFLNVAPI